VPAVRWKTQTILVRPAILNGGPDKLLADLGYARRRQINEVPFSRAGEDGSIWIGSLGDCVVIETIFAWSFFVRPEDTGSQDKEFLDFKSALLHRFAEAEIAVLVLESVADGWGFAVFRNAALARCQFGADGSVDHDEGSRLPVEETYLSKLHRTESGDTTKEDFDMDASAVGQSLINEICRSLSGYSLDDLDDRVQGANFWVNDDESIYRAKAEAMDRPPPAVRPWWKFWGAGN
jgi:hypothetical protein